MKKYSARFEEDFKFYLDNKEKFNFYGGIVDLGPYNENINVKQAFYQFDTYGKVVGCVNPRLLQQIIICKKSVNWHIKEWVLGYNDLCQGVDFYIKEFINPPEWIEKAFRMSLYRSCRKYL